MVVPDKTILFAVIFIKESNGEESQDLSTICSQILSNYCGGKKSPLSTVRKKASLGHYFHDNRYLAMISEITTSL